MWEYNSEYNKWNMSIDNMIDDDYQFYLQELSLVRFYSKALSGATYLPVSNFNNIYDVLGSYKARNWYIGIDGSDYTNTLIPSFNAESINATTSVDYYDNEYFFRMPLYVYLFLYLLLLHYQGEEGHIYLLALLL